MFPPRGFFVLFVFFVFCFFSGGVIAGREGDHSRTVVIIVSSSFVPFSSFFLPGWFMCCCSPSDVPASHPVVAFFSPYLCLFCGCMSSPRPFRFSFYFFIFFIFDLFLKSDVPTYLPSYLPSLPTYLKELHDFGCLCFPFPHQVGVPYIILL